jgi:anti-sigma regulatory factor (Ser/Thr protein kinase)
MATSSALDRFAIELPADAAYLSTVRLFASAVARQFGAEEETIEDLKMAVSEACSAFLRYDDEGAGIVRATIDLRDARLSFEVTGEDLSIQVPPRSPDDPTPTPRGMAAELGLDLIRSLFPDSEVTTDDRSVIRFSAALS